MESALNQVGRSLAVGELYYRLNPISLDDFWTTLPERPLANGLTIFFFRLYKFQNHNFAQEALNKLKSDLNMSVQLLISILLL